jgi:hypothetical protein
MTTTDSQTPFFHGFYESVHLSETDLDYDLEYVKYYKYSSLEVKEFIENYSGLWGKFIAENKVQGKRNYKKEFIENFCPNNNPYLYNGYSTQEAKERVCKNYSEFVFTHLELPRIGVEEILHTGVWSPSEYNFSTDTAEIRIVFSDKELFKSQVQSAIKENRELFERLIRSQFTSCDGFNSYYSNDPQDWFNFDFSALRSNSADFDNITLKTYLTFLLIVSLIESYNSFDTCTPFSEIYESDGFDKLQCAIGEYFNYSIMND